jgi:hypothetical protein
MGDMLGKGTFSEVLYYLYKGNKSDWFKRWKRICIEKNQIT